MLPPLLSYTHFINYWLTFEWYFTQKSKSVFGEKCTIGVFFIDKLLIQDWYTGEKSESEEQKGKETSSVLKMRNVCDEKAAKDLIDLILEIGKFREKLFLTNVKNVKN